VPVTSASRSQGAGYIHLPESGCRLHPPPGVRVPVTSTSRSQGAGVSRGKERESGREGIMEEGRERERETASERERQGGRERCREKARE